VFLDLNDDGVLSPGEPTGVTDQYGTFTAEGVTTPAWMIFLGGTLFIPPLLFPSLTLFVDRPTILAVFEGRFGSVQGPLSFSFSRNDCMKGSSSRTNILLESPSSTLGSNFDPSVQSLFLSESTILTLPQGIRCAHSDCMPRSCQQSFPGHSHFFSCKASQKQPSYKAPPKRHPIRGWLPPSVIP
jgi:hypothetical protein